MKRYNSFDEVEHKHTAELPPVDPAIWEDLLWFQDDQLNEYQQEAGQLNYQYHRHQESFNLWYFLEAFVLHFVYQMFLGPFILIPALVYWPYLRLMANMSFFGGGVGHAITTVQWIGNLLILLSRYYWELSTIGFGVVTIAFIVTGLRAAFISARYATYPDQYRARYLNRYITSQEKSRFLLAGPWGQQDPNFVEEMIEHAMRRKYVDESTFKVAFIEEPSDKIKEMLKMDLSMGGKLHIDIGKTTVEAAVGSENQTYYDGKAILFHLFNNYKRTFVARHILKLVGIPGLIIGIFFAMLPAFGRLNADRSFCGYDPIEIIMFWVAWAFNALAFFTLLFSFMVIYRDYDRINYCLEQLGQMYSVSKRSDVDEKLFPTINLADAISLQSWLNLRKLVYDYGINFHSRHRIYIPCLLVVAFGCIQLSVSHELVYKDINQGDLTVLQWVLIPSAIFFGFKFVVLIRKCQLINEHYDTHLELVRENQNIYQTVHHFRDYYIRGNEDIELPFDVNEAFTTEPRSIAHVKIIEKFKALVGTNMRQLDEYAEKLVEMQNEFVGEIERENRFHSKTFLGFRVNFAIFGAVAIGYVVLIFYGYLYDVVRRQDL